MESRYEKAVKKYSPHLNHSVIEQFAYSDPSKDHKYLDWMCSKTIERCDMVAKKSTFLMAGLQYVEEMVEMVIQFHNQRSKFTKKNFDTFIKGSWFYLGDREKIENSPTDIHSYSTYYILEHYLKHITKIMTRKDHRDIAHSETKIIFEDDQWKVLVPLTQRASIHYGRGTKWCTSSETDNQYEQYEANGNLIYVIGPEKFAFYHSWDENEYTWYNDADKRMTQNDIRGILPLYILKEVYIFDEYHFSEYDPGLGDRGYFLKPIRDLNFKDPNLTIDGWVLDYDDNAGVWKFKDDKSTDLRLWINPTHNTPNDFSWMCVISDEYYKRVLATDEAYYLSSGGEADELIDRIYIPIKLSLKGNYDTDKEVILKDYLDMVRHCIGKVQPLIDDYLQNLEGNRRKRLIDIQLPHYFDEEDGEMYTPKII